MSTAVLAVKQTATNQERDEASYYDEATRHYASMRATFDTTAGYRNVLGVRVQTPISASNRGGSYDDFVWTLWISADGTKHATQYEANTEPSQRYEDHPRSGGQDANRDGRDDLGRLPTGVYTYANTLITRPVIGNVFRLTEAQRIERDVNHDGYFNEADTALITNPAAMNEGQTMHFHQGGRNITGSAGCQTMRPDVWTRFIADIARGRRAGQRSFTYVLINQ